MGYSLETHAEPSRIIYIDSRDDSTYLATTINGQPLNSYFQYILKEDLVCPANQRMLISLHSATIPYSFYNVRDGVNDIIRVKIDHVGGGGSSTDIDIPRGNYNSITLAQVLETLIPASVPETITLEIDFDPDTNKFKFIFSSTTSYVYSFDFADTTQPFANLELGFRNELSQASASQVGSNYLGTITSSNVADLNGSIHGVYIRTNLVSKSTLDSQTGNFSNILERLPLNVQSGGILFHDSTGGTFKSIIDLRTINIVTIRLTDERNRILDLNGLHFQLAIQIDFVYAKKPIVAPEGANSENRGLSYSVNLSAGEESAQRLLQGQQRFQQEQEEEARQSTRRGPGRPRRVGRPKGS